MRYTDLERFWKSDALVALCEYTYIVISLLKFV